MPKNHYETEKFGFVLQKGDLKFFRGKKVGRI